MPMRANSQHRLRSAIVTRMAPALWRPFSRNQPQYTTWWIRSISPNQFRFWADPLDLALHVGPDPCCQTTMTSVTRLLGRQQSSMALTEQEIEWQRARREVYDDLLRSGREGINRDAIRHARQFFLSDGSKFVPKPYTFPNDSDAVGLVAAVIPQPFAKKCIEMGDELVAQLPGEPDTNHITGYVNDVNTMHMTLFHTSHPDDLMPDARTRQPQDIATLRELASRFKPLTLKPHRVVLCSSGAIVLLYEVDESSDCDPFTVDRLRELAKTSFSPFPKRQSKAIMHSTLARLLSPDVPQDAVERVHRHCELLTQQLHRENESVVVRDLWFVDETHHYWASGHTTVIPLGSQSAE